MKPLILLLLAFHIGYALAAEDTVYLEETVIIGNQELPKVLYILPWRDMDTQPLPQRAFEFTAQSVLVPVYPEEQQREINLRQLLRQARDRQEARQTHLIRPQPRTQLDAAEVGPE